MFLYLVLFSILLLYLYFKTKFSYWERRGLQTPPVLPFFGTALHENLFRKRDSELKYRKKYGPVFGTYSGVKPIFNTSDVEHIKQVLSQDDIFHSQGTVAFNDKYLGKSLLLQNGHPWKEARMAMSHFFTSSKLRNLMNHYELVANKFLKNLDETLRKNGSDLVDIRFLTKCYGIDMIAKIVLAIDIDSFNQQNSDFVKYAISLDEISMARFVLLALIPAEVAKFFKLTIFNDKASDALGDLFKQVIRERRNKNVRYNDLTEQMEEQIQLKNLNLDEDTVVGNSILSFFAGVDNISNNLCIILLLLIENPEIKQKLTEEIEKEFSNEITYEKLMENAYLDACVKESLRLKGVILGMERTAVEDTQIGEYKIEKGCGVLLLVDSVHNNPDLFPEPFKFDPERFLNKSLQSEKNFFGFGGGNKNCIGMRLAYLEMKYLIVRILLNYDFYKSADSKVENITVRTFSGIKKCSLCFKKKN